MTETEVTYSRSENYSRSQRGGRRRRQEAVSFNEEWKEELPPTKVVSAIVWSLLLSLLSVANPFLTQLATNLQSQDLYAGIAMQAGQSPYGAFFGTSGILYYLLVFVGSWFGTTWGLALLQWLALSVAGIYFYKISAYFSRSSHVANNLQTWFYLFLLAVNFGGVQASLFALPFVLMGLWILVRYFENAVRDEAFILYGIEAALAFFIYPKSSLLWFVAVPILCIYNLTHRQAARGIYQALATVFGFLLVGYAVGYYAFIEQILGAAIQQTFFYGMSLHFTHPGIVWTSLVVLIFLLLSGFLKQSLQTLVSFGQEQHRYSKIALFLTFLASLLFIIAGGYFDWGQLVLLLPYGLVMAIVGHPTHRIHEMDDDYSYLASNLYMPLFVCLLMFVQPAMTYFVDESVTRERAEVADYIENNSKTSDRIYVWDDSAQVYLRSKRLSAGEIIAAEPYLDTKANQKSLAFDLGKSKAEYIVVNSQVPILDVVQSTLEDNYEKVEELATTQFSLYKRK